jgi:hypothetical protein
MSPTAGEPSSAGVHRRRQTPGRLAQYDAPLPPLCDAGQVPAAIVGEPGPETAATLTASVLNLGPRVSLLSAECEVLARLRMQPLGEAPGQFIAPHSIAVDSRGDIYVAEVSNTYWPVLFGKKPDRELQKLARLS